MREVKAHTVFQGQPRVTKLAFQIYNERGNPSMKLFVGLDVSKAKLDACFLSREDDANTVIWQDTVSNSDAGATIIKDKILHFHDEFEFDKILVGMEATGQYSMHPSLFFSNNPELQLINVQT